MKNELPLSDFNSNSFQPTAEHFRLLFLALQKIASEMEHIKNEIVNLHYASPYFTRKEAMQYLKITRKKFWEMESSGEINAYILGDTNSLRMKRYKREDLDHLLKQQPTFMINVR